MGFLRGNLHARWGKLLPAGNWSLIGSEVEGDQLSSVTVKKRVPMTKVEEKRGSWKDGWPNASGRGRRKRGKKVKKMWPSIDKVR